MSLQTPITGVDYSYIFVWVGMFTVMYLARNVVPNTSLKDWANDEAAERLRRRELGLDVKFGTNYATLRALGQEPDDSEE